MRNSAPQYVLFTYADNIGSFQVFSSPGPGLKTPFETKCDLYKVCGWSGAVHGLVVNVPGSPSSSACAGLDNVWPQASGMFRSCSVRDCALGSCVANSAMRSDFPILYSLSYDRPVITHQSRDSKSGKSAFGPTRGGWLLTIVGRNFGNYADGNTALIFLSLLLFHILMMGFMLCSHKRFGFKLSIQQCFEVGYIREVFTRESSMQDSLHSWNIC
jgi:hypothetical protein